MPTTKPWQQGPPGRRPSSTQERRRVLIVCEDTKSACFYFQRFPVDPKRAEVCRIGAGMNTDGLVEHAIGLKSQAAPPFSAVWCVFDRDSFPLQNYCRAFELARSNGISVAWANEAFELWYLLHFNYHDTGISRHDHRARLRQHGLEYDKSDSEIYEKLKSHQEVALRNARRLQRHWNDMGERFPERQNPSLGVHRLVEFLNELAELGG